MKRFTSLMLLLLCAMATFAQLSTGQYYTIKNVTAEKYLSVAGDNSNMQVKELAFSNLQAFQLEDAGEGKFYIKSVDGETTYYANATSWNFSATTNAENKTPFTIALVDGETDVYSIYQDVANYTGYAGTDATDAGSPIYCNKTINQNGKWVFEVIETHATVLETGKEYRLKSALSGLYMQCVDFNKASGEGAFQLKTRSNEESQIFTLENAEEGKYYLKTSNGETSYYVNVESWNFIAGAEANATFTITLENEIFTTHSIHQESPNTTFHGYAGNKDNGANAADGTYIYNNQPNCTEGCTTWFFVEVGKEAEKTKIQLQDAITAAESYILGDGYGEYTSSDNDYATKFQAVKDFYAAINSETTVEDILAQIDILNNLVNTLTINTLPLTSTHYYIIKNKQHGTILTDISGKAGIAAKLDETDKSQQWIIEVLEDGKYRLKNRATNNYLEYTASGNTCWNVNATGSEFYIGIQTTSVGHTPAYYFISGVEIGDPSSTVSQTCAHDANWGSGYGYKQIVTWKNDSDASLWDFIKTSTEVLDTYNVTYKFMYEGVIVATQTVTVEAEAEYPAFAIPNAPLGVTAATEKPQGKVNADYEMEVELTINDELIPFEYVAEGEPTVWYYARLHANNQKYVQDNGDGNIEWADVTIDDANEIESHLWGFVGNAVTGFKMINKGTGKAVKSTDSGNATMVEVADATKFHATANMYERANQFCLKNIGGNNWLNAQGTNVKHHNQNDNGSSFLLTEYSEEDITVTGAGWATMYLASPVYIPEGVNAYIITGTENGIITTVQLEGTIPANTGVLLQNEGTFTFKKSAGTAANVTGNLMDGSVEDQYVAANAYVLAVGNEGIGFYKAELNCDETGAEGDTHFLNNAGKAYFVLPATENSAAFYGFDWNGTTGVENVVVENGVKAIFDLTGRRVEAITAPGIYIVNGKKVLVK